MMVLIDVGSENMVNAWFGDGNSVVILWIIWLVGGLEMVE